MLLRLIILFVSLISFSSHAVLYKHTDQEGVTTYSDVKTQGAEEIETPKGNAIQLPKYVPKRTYPGLNRDKKTYYSEISITSPSDEAVISNNAGNITIQLSVKPALVTSKGHYINVYLDGSKTSTNNTSTSIPLSFIDRGSHQVSAEIVDAEKNVLIKSKSVTFHMKRFSKLHK